MTRDPNIYHQLYSIICYGKLIPYPFGSNKLHTTIVNDNKAPSNHIKVNMNIIVFLGQWHHILQPLELLDKKEKLFFLHLIILTKHSVYTTLVWNLWWSLLVFLWSIHITLNIIWSILLKIWKIHMNIFHGNMPLTTSRWLICLIPIELFTIYIAQ